MQLKHKVEGRHFQRADIGHAKRIGNMLDRGTGQPAFLLLRAPQQRNDGRGLTPFGVFRYLALSPGLVRLGKGKSRGLFFVQTA